MNKLLVCTCGNFCANWCRNFFRNVRAGACVRAPLLGVFFVKSYFSVIKNNIFFENFFKKMCGCGYVRKK